MRLIDADALINNLEMLISEQEEDDHVETWNNAITCAINEVKHHAPTVDAVKHGEWTEREVDADGRAIDEWQSAKCSACGLYHTTPYLYYFDEFKYCPNCGARMDGETCNNAEEKLQ